MSRIGKLPVNIENGASVALNNELITVTGPKGTLTYSHLKGIIVKVEDGKVLVSQEEKTKEKTKAIFGLTRALIASMMEGVTKGFEKKLELAGVGYRAQVNGNELVLSLGFSHPVKFPAPEGIAFKVTENVISISGIDKMLVGNMAAKIRAVKPPEPYKGKGIKYQGEKIRRKAGKAAKVVGGAK